ncbi:hypothetical protein [Oerskovia turbata]
MLMQVRPDGRQLPEICDALGLTRSQVRGGLRWIREVAASEHYTPLTYSRRAGYQLSDDPGVWTTAELAHARAQLTAIKTALHGLIYPHLKRLPDDPYVQEVLIYAEAMLRSAEHINRIPHDGTRTPLPSI